MKTGKFLPRVLLIGLLLALAGSVGLGLAQGPEPPEAKVQPQGEVSITAAVSSRFSYQGVLKENSSPVTGSRDMTFRLYSDDACTTQVGSDIVKSGVQVADGLFSVELDVTHGDFIGQGLWLEAEVGGTKIGCQEILPVPYALSLRPGATISAEEWGGSGVIVNSASGNGLHVNTAGNDGVYVTSAGRDGLHVNTAGRNGLHVSQAAENGVYAHSSGGTGVYGSSSGGIGVSGASSSSTGVYGSSSSSYGVYGYSNTGVGVYASNNSGIALKVMSQVSGNLIEAWHGPMFPDREFYVSGAGYVYADGSYNTPAADFAEMLSASDGLEPGDVLVVGSDGKLTRSTQPYQASVVGVYSTRPGFVGGAGDDEDLTGKVPLAMMGVAPVKVTAENGPIHPGDMLVASSIPGHAMKAAPNPAVGTVIGKALEGLDEGTGVIQMLVMLQ